MTRWDKPSETVLEGTGQKGAVVPMYKVILHNDDATPMEFVVFALMRFFISDRNSAEAIMTEAHKEGRAMVAVMPFERAEFKVSRAHGYARANGFPLTFSIEPCD